MKKVQLGTVIHSLNTGLNPRKFFQLNTPDAEFYYVTIKEMVDGKIVYNENTDRLNEKALELCNRRSNLEKGDVLFSGTGTIGKTVVLTETPTTWNIKEGVYTIKPKQDLLNSNYLSYVLSSDSIKNNYMTNVAGGTVKSLKMADLEKTVIPLPPLLEQQKIVAELDTIQSAINNKKQQLSLLDEAVKSEFVEMFGEGSCKQIPFSEYAEIIDGDRGKNYPKSEDFSDDDYCLFLSAKNVTKNGFLFENNQFISKEKDEILRKGKLNRGDIVITTRGTIGNIAYFDDSIPYENIRINSGMVIIRNKDLEFNQRFFLEAFRNKIDEIIATQVTGAAQPQLPIHIMSKITLPYPDLPLQNKFAAFVQQIDKSKFVVKQQISDLQEFLDSKMQEYFGE